jgi:PAS domain S-box-containing protein
VNYLSSTKSPPANEALVAPQWMGEPEVSIATSSTNGRYRQWLDSLLEGCQIISFDWRYLYVNDTAAKRTQRSKEGLLGHTLMEVDPHIKRTEMFSRLRHCMEERTPDRMDYEFTLPDGTKNWLMLVFEPVPEGTLVMSLDITDRKRVEDALGASEERNRLLIENASVGIAIMKDGNLDFVNAQFRDTMGCSSDEELISRPFLDLIHQDDRERAKEFCLSGLRDSEAAATHVFRAIDKGGNTKWLETSLVLFSWKGGPAMLAFAKDITDRKEAERELWVRNGAMESSLNAIILLNLEGKVNWVNSAFLNMWQLDSDQEVLSKPLADIVLPSQRAQVAKILAQLAEEGRWQGELTGKRSKNHSKCTVLLSANAVKDEEGKPICIMCTFTDITDRKNAEEQERHIQEQLALSSRLASVGRLASGVAHEINNPLTAVIGCSQMLMEREVPADMKQDLEVINESAQQVARIVKNLLTFGHQTKPGKECVDINALIKRVLDLRTYEMKTHNIVVTTRLAPDLPWTMADGGLIQQVLLNIILNAEQAIAKATNRGRLLVKTEQARDFIRITFRDNGVGIARKDLPKVFDPFFTTKGVGEGTGLGLSLSYGIIKEHDGRIYARSNPGKGATFVIELPIVEEQNEPEPDKPVAEEPLRAAGARILIVDDEPAICQFLKRLLTEEGHNVDSVYSANAALEKLRQERFSLILLDIRMKGMNGIELYEQLGRIALSLQRRVIFITGDTLAPDTRSFLEKSEAHFICKPFDVGQLRKTINQTLTKRSEARSG